MRNTGGHYDRIPATNPNLLASDMKQEFSFENPECLTARIDVKGRDIPSAAKDLD